MLIKNERQWVRPWLLNVLPVVNEIVIYDGNSTDGTLEEIKRIQRQFPYDAAKIRVFHGKDPLNLRDDYTRLFNDCLHELTTDWAWFHHPDMHVLNPEMILKIRDMYGIAMSVEMESFGGEPGGPLYRIVRGRGRRWTNIFRLRNPDLGLHYHGWYGSAEENCYFSAITGNRHEFNNEPFDVVGSGIKVNHYSDVRPFDRRWGRMRTCLLNQGIPDGKADIMARRHPRVTLKDGEYGNVTFKFEQTDYPQSFKKLTEVSEPCRS